MEGKSLLPARSRSSRDRGRQLTVGPEVAMRAMFMFLVLGFALFAVRAIVMFANCSGTGC